MNVLFDEFSFSNIKNIKKPKKKKKYQKTKKKYFLSFLYEYKKLIFLSLIKQMMDIKLEQVVYDRDRKGIRISKYSSSNEKWAALLYLKYLANFQGDYPMFFSIFRHNQLDSLTKEYLENHWTVKYCIFGNDEDFVIGNGPNEIELYIIEPFPISTTVYLVGDDLHDVVHHKVEPISDERIYLVASHREVKKITDFQKRFPDIFSL